MMNSFSAIKEDHGTPSITAERFGQLSDGRSVEIYTLNSGSGIEARITNYGGTLVSLMAPDRNGALGDVVLGFATLDEYEKHRIFLGSLIGRFANRIAAGRFSLNGKMYSLAVNNGPNHLHGGNAGFDRAIWSAQIKEELEKPALRLSYLSVDGEEGYPGNLSVDVEYALNDRSELSIRYSAVSDADTIINLTNHSYFNLAGTGDVLAHRLRLNAERFTPVDDSLIPTGEIRAVDGTPFDFREPKEIGADIDHNDQQLTMAGGYDHNWVLGKSEGELSLAAVVFEPESGRSMEVLTTEPGIQFYSGNFLDGGLTGKNGRKLGYRTGFCLETQHFPDSANQPSFPSVVLRAGEQYHQETVYRFSTRPHQL